jgi:hypothetical protein
MTAGVCDRVYQMTADVDDRFEKMTASTDESLEMTAVFYQFERVLVALLAAGINYSLCLQWFF